MIPERNGFVAVPNAVNELAEWASPSFLQNLRFALCLLTEAQVCAQNLARPAWEFAVDILEMRRGGVTDGALRWLIAAGFVEHSAEVRTHKRRAERVFCPVPALTLSPRSCFVVTQTGLGLARRLRIAPGCSVASIGPGRLADDEDRSPAPPHWDSDCRELHAGGELVKRFRRPAPNQETILAVFEEEGWPTRIDDPLPARGNHCSAERLHDTIKSLNRHTVRPILHFSGDGTGRGVRWRWERGIASPTFP
jgi:hypothetical protein